jgi:hypothetical protein
MQGRDDGNPGLVALGVSLAVLAAFQQFKLPVVLPVLLDLYRYDRVLAGGFMSVYALAGLLLSVVLGRLVARRGARGRCSAPWPCSPSPPS